MNVKELIGVLNTFPGEAEIRIGDQIEAGPYLNASVGGVWVAGKGDVIITANDDNPWRDENWPDDQTLQVAWAPPQVSKETLEKRGPVPRD